MTIICVAENKCECLAVTFQNKGWVRVQKLEDVSEDENIDVDDIDKLFGYSIISNCQKLGTYKIHSNYA